MRGSELQCNTLREITDDIDNARIYGGIHFRYDQEAGSDQEHRNWPLYLQRKTPLGEGV